MGLTYLGKLATDGFGLSRTVPHPASDGIDGPVQKRLMPRIDAAMLGDRMTGFTDTTRIDMAEAVLTAMSMTKDFARIVLLAGHGSTTVNNPHASGLDCGACGGHTGEANARVAAAILNDPLVRAGLGERGIAVPQDTVFLGALHDTTTDAVTDLRPGGDTAPAMPLTLRRSRAGSIGRAVSPARKGQHSFISKPAGRSIPRSWRGAATGPRSGRNGDWPAAPPSSRRHGRARPGSTSVAGRSCTATTGGRTRTSGRWN